MRESKCLETCSPGPPIPFLYIQYSCPLSFPLFVLPSARCLTPALYLVSLSMAFRQAHQDRKIEAAQEVIVATKSFSPATDSPKRNHNIQPSSDTRLYREGEKNAKKVKEAPDSATTPPQQQRLGFDKSSWGDELVQEGAGEAGRHEDIVDVSRRPAGAPRKYTEEELDRFCESCSSSKTKVGALHVASSGLSAVGGSDPAAAWGVRRTPRRVPVRPSSSRMGVTKGRVLHGTMRSTAKSDSKSLRAMRGRLIVS